MTARPIRLRSVALVGLGVLLSAAAALAQPPGNGHERILDEQTIGPDAIRRLAAQLKALQGGELPTDLINKVRELVNRPENKGKSAEQLAQQLKQENHWSDQQIAQMQDLLKRFGGNLPQSDQLPGLNPNMGGVPPVQRSENGNGQPDRPPADLHLPRHNPTQPQPGDPDQPQGQGVPPGGNPNEPPNPIQLPNEGQVGDRQLPPFRPGGENLDPNQLAQRQQQFRAVAGWWEQNVGPLNESPAVRQLLLEMFTGQSPSGTDAGAIGDLFNGSSGDGRDFGRWADRLGLSGWKAPDLGLGGGHTDLGGSSGGWSAPRAPDAPSFGGVSGGGAGSWLPVILFLVVAAGGLVLWWLWPKLTGKEEAGSRPLPGLGPWPVDPRAIADREALVKAFEYLSVLVCGGGARVWNHVTIAAALERAVPQAEALADPLARLYAVARYTPAGEPLPPGAIAEARGYLCELAGVPAA